MAIPNLYFDTTKKKCFQKTDDDIQLKVEMQIRTHWLG